MIIASAGFVTPPKKINWVIDALIKLGEQGYDFTYLILGECKSDVILDKINNSSIKSKIKILGYLSDEKFDEYFLSADLIPTMRFPSAGESSGVACRALGFGKIAIVPEYASFSNFPDDLCEKVYLNEGDVVEQIFGIIKKYLDNRPLLESKKREILEKSTAYSIDKTLEKYKVLFNKELSQI